MTRATAGAELRAGGRVALFQDMVKDDAVVVVGDLGLVPELDGLAEPALGDRPGILIMQADPPACPVRHVPGYPLPGLRGDRPGHLQQPGQVIDRPAQPAPPPPRSSIPDAGRDQGRRLRRGAAQRPAPAGQHPPRLPGGAFGQGGQLPGHPQHHGLLLVPGLRGPGRQLRCDRVCPPATRDDLG
jgi:hypothetical protein